MCPVLNGLFDIDRLKWKKKQWRERKDFHKASIYDEFFKTNKST